MSEDDLKQKADGERRAKAARVALALTIAGLVVNVVGATTFWIALPEKMRATTAMLADHEARIRATETKGAEQAGTLGRIDERTKAIQDSIGDLKTGLRDVKARP